MRSSTVAADVMIRRLFASWLVPDAWPERGHYSLILGPTVPSRAGERALSILFDGGVPIVRSRSARRVLRALAAHLASYGADPAPAGLLRLKAVAAVGERGGVLLPSGALEHFDLGHFQRALAGIGLRLVDEPAVDLDLATGELVLTPPLPLPLDEAVAELPGVRPEETIDDDPPVGRFPLLSWAVALPTERIGPPTLAEAVAQGVTLLADGAADSPQRSAERVVDLARSCRLVRFDKDSMEETLAALGAAPGGQ